MQTLSNMKAIEGELVPLPEPVTEDDIAADSEQS